jgi:hypothetical protein
MLSLSDLRPGIGPGTDLLDCDGCVGPHSALPLWRQADFIFREVIDPMRDRNLGEVVILLGYNMATRHRNRETEAKTIPVLWIGDMLARLDAHMAPATRQDDEAEEGDRWSM